MRKQEQLSLNHKPCLVSAHPYDKNYYDHYHTDMGSVPYVREQGPWLPLFRAMAEYIGNSIGPKKVLDAGCAKVVTHFSKYAAKLIHFLRRTF